MSTGAENGKKKARKPVQVVVCPDMPSHRPKQHRNRMPEVQDDEDQVVKSRKQMIREEFDNTFEQVKKFAVEGMNVQDRKRHDLDRIHELGGQQVKQQKVPFNILMGLRKKAASREKRRQEEIKHADLVSHQKKAPYQIRQQHKYKQSAYHKAKAQEKNRDFGLQITQGGRYKRGVLQVAADNSGKSSSKRRRK